MADTEECVGSDNQKYVPRNRVRKVFSDTTIPFRYLSKSRTPFLMAVRQRRDSPVVLWFDRHRK
jgi:hypothetical protein